jgi:hypothetical protein
LRLRCERRAGEKRACANRRTNPALDARPDHVRAPQRAFAALRESGHASFLIR